MRVSVHACVCVCMCVYLVYKLRHAINSSALLLAITHADVTAKLLPLMSVNVANYPTEDRALIRSYGEREGNRMEGGKERGRGRETGERKTKKGGEGVKEKDRRREKGKQERGRERERE